MTRRFEWFDLGNGRQIGRWVDDGPPPARSHLACPMLNIDTIDPVTSMADGKIYTSKAAIRASYKPGGNPQGAEYVEVGNDPARLRPKQKVSVDRTAIRDAIRSADAQLKN